MYNLIDKLIGLIINWLINLVFQSTLPIVFLLTIINMELSKTRFLKICNKNT